MARSGAVRGFWCLVAATLGCGGGERATTTPADTATAAPPEAPAAPALTEDGLGAVRIGASREAAAAALGETLPAPESIECDYVHPTALPEGVLLMLVRDTVARIDVTRPEVRTAQGAGIGSTEREVQDAYADRVQVQPHKYTDGHYLVVTGADTLRRIVFETDGTVVTVMRSGRLPEVQWVEGCS